MFNYFILTILTLCSFLHYIANKVTLFLVKESEVLGGTALQKRFAKVMETCKLSEINLNFLNHAKPSPTAMEI